MSIVNPFSILESITPNHVNLDDVINVHAIYEGVNEFFNGKLDIFFDDNYVKRLISRLVIRCILNDKPFDPNEDYMQRYLFLDQNDLQM